MVSEAGPAMLPLTLDPRVAAALAGSGDALRRRLATLRAAGMRPRVVLGRGPDAAELAGVRLLFVAGLTPEEAAPVASLARLHGVLVNVEDQPALCDFHLPAVVRRGDLTLAVATAGKAPGFAARIARHLGTLFGAEWAERVARIAARRAALRAAGHPQADVARALDAMVASEGWLQSDASSTAASSRTHWRNSSTR